MRTLSLIVSLLIVATSAAAQTLVPYLLPLVPAQNVPGAHGSLWETDLVVENSSDRTITVTNNGCLICVSPPPPGAPFNVPPQSTITNPVVVATVGNIGGMLFVLDSDVSAIRMHLRVHDLSREAESFGTEIPVLTPPAFRPVIRLIEVPTDPRFRVTLRIYSIDFAPAAHILVLPPSGTTSLRDMTVPMNLGAAQLEPVSGLTEPFVRIVVTAVDGVTPVWAMASVTNNDTQDVTTIIDSP